MEGKLWNIGMKVGNVEAEARYFVSIGGSLRVHERLETPGGIFEYALVDFGGTRLFLTPKTVFEDRLGSPLADGLTHAVFEVENVDTTLVELKATGTEVLLDPIEISAGLGSRRLAFCRSPGGLVFEVMQIHESLVQDEPDSAPSDIAEKIVTWFENLTKQKLKAGELALGFGVHHLRTSATAMIAAAAGHDWLFIDMEHGAFSVHDVAQICLAALPTGITPIVRISAQALDEGTRALDNGAMGVIVPHVDTAEQARHIARAFRYPPLGIRSWGGPPAAFGFVPPTAAEAQSRLNAAILVIAMIESPEGLRNAAGIVSTEGIDGLLIGTGDLSAEMGVSGQIGHPAVQQAYRTIGDACRSHGKVLGMGGVYDQEWATHYIRGGARLVLTGTDHSYLLAGARARSEVLREAMLQPRL